MLHMMFTFWQALWAPHGPVMGGGTFGMSYLDHTHSGRD